MTEIVFASHNAGKIKEVKALLAPLGYEIADEVKLSDVDETGTTFAENALLKARAAFKETEKPSIADDSGLCVHALNNEPGVYTARYAEKMGGYDKAFKNLLTRTKEDRSAQEQ